MLFQLIKSLSRSEKRYFNIQSKTQSGGDTHYLRLFDLLDKMESYSEEELEKKLTREPFKNNIHVVKNYLNQVILRTLRSYHEKNSAEIKMLNLLMDSTILQNKGLYEQSEKLLRKLKKTADLYDYKLLILEVIRRKLSLSLIATKKNDSIVRELTTTLKQILEDVSSEFELYGLRTSMISVQRSKFKLSEKKSRQKVNEIVQHPLLRSGTPPSGFYAQYLYHRTLASYHHYGKNYQEAFIHYEKVVGIWDNHPHIIAEKPQLYKIQLSNFLAVCHTLSKKQNILDILQILKSMPSNSFDEEAETFQNVAYFQLLYFMNNLQFKEAIAFVPEVRSGLIKYGRKINKARQLAFSYNLSILYFALAQYDDALEWLSLILNESKNEHRQDIQHFARFLELIVHYEKESFEIYDYLLRSLVRYFQQQFESISAFKKLLLNHLKKLPGLLDMQSTKQQFEVLLAALNDLPDGETKLLGVEEIHLWATAKTEGQSFLDVMKTKYAND